MPADTVLIVDDNPANLKLARILLVGEGYEVRTAMDAEQALLTLQTYKPRMILMDIQLPGMDGLTLARRLKAGPTTREIVIVALTAYAMKGDEERARAAGCDGYIAKPIDPDLLPMQVARYLGRTSQSARPLEPRLAGRSILLVEPDPVQRRTHRQALAAAGHDVAEAFDAPTALVHLTERAIDLVVLSLAAPETSGVEVMAAIRALPAAVDIPIIGLSSARSLGDEPLARAVGLNDVLVTPLDPTTLVERIQGCFPAPLAEAEQRGRGRRVLVVDDDPVQLKLVALHLTQAGFEVLTASDGATALALARERPPALVVSDALMPSMDGFELCLAIREDAALRGIPVFLLSSHYRAETDFELAQEVGADAFLLRTWDLQMVTRRIIERLEAGSKVPPPTRKRITKEERERRLVRQLELQSTINVSLTQRCALQAAQLSALGAVSDVLARSGDAEGPIRDLLTACLTASGITKGAIYPLDARKVLSLGHIVGFTDEERPALVGLLTKHQALFARVLVRQVAELLPSPVVPSDAVRPLMAALGVGSVLVVPLMGAQECLGVLLLGSIEKNLAEQDHVQFGRALGSSVGQAMALARAFHSVAAAELRKTQFLNVLGHELRNPLASIVNALHLADVPTALPEAIARARTVVSRQVTYLKRMVEELLDASQIMHGKARLVREPLDLRTLVTEVSDELKVAGAHERTLVVEVPEARVVVGADRARLAQVIGNLLENSIKFTPPGGRITVRVTADETTAALQVVDDGEGVSPEHLPHMFEPFVQGDRKLNSGLGLGLSIVKGIVLLHGGQVSAASGGLDRGLEVTVTLPLATVTAARREVPRPRELGAPTESLRILLVEDNVDSAEMLKELLELKGHEVSMAHTGQDGVALAARFLPEVVLCDLGLPGMDGCEVARALRADARTAHAKLVAITGYGEDEVRVRTRDAGFDRHLTKPVDPDELDVLMAILVEADRNKR